MTENRFQHLTEAFNSIISMMLASLRVRGWRGLLDLPNIVMAAIYLRRLGREFAAIIASLDLAGIDLSALPPAAPVPPDQQAAPAQAAPADRARPRRAAHPRAHRARRKPPASPITAAPTTAARRTSTPRARHHASVRPRRAPALRALPASLLDRRRTR